MKTISKNDLWVERYRPKAIEELVLEQSVRELLNKFITEKSMPHLLLIGNVGCGKTTIAKILINSLDCDSILLNASDERGIDVIREKVKRFAMISSFKQWKIVFLDEADAITMDAQDSMRNLMETYSEQTRFILTANYGNRIKEPIRSRCQVIEFKNLQRKEIRLLLEKILNTEGIKYEVDDLLILIDTYYPDIRSMINNIQLHTINGKWTIKGIDSFREFEKLVELIKKGDLAGIRELDLEYMESMKYLFDKVEELTDDKQKQVDMMLLLADFMWKDWGMADKSINFAACCLLIMEKLK